MHEVTPARGRVHKENASKQAEISAVTLKFRHLKTGQTNFIVFFTNRYLHSLVGQQPSTKETTMGKAMKYLSVVLLIVLGALSIGSQANAAESDEGILVGRIAHIEGRLLRYVSEEKDWVVAVKIRPLAWKTPSIQRKTPRPSSLCRTALGCAWVATPRCSS